MLREEESVDGPTHQCSLSPATQRMLSRCFKDIVRTCNFILVERSNNLPWLTVDFTSLGTLVAPVAGNLWFVLAIVCNVN